MTVIDTRNWQSRNQDGLARALAGLKAMLQHHADRSQPTTTGSNGAIDVAVDSPSPYEPELTELEIPCDDLSPGLPPALAALQVAFGLSSFECDLLLLCAGIELDSTVASLCGAAQGEPSRAYPTFSLALAVLPDAHWSALSPDAPLRHWRLIDVGVGPALTVSPLRIDERVLHQLVGVPHLDERLAGLVEPIEMALAAGLAPSHAAIAERVASVWSEPREPQTMPLIHLCGPEAADRRAVAVAAATTVGLRVAALPADLIPTAAAELNALVRLWEREAALSGARAPAGVRRSGPRRRSAACAEHPKAGRAHRGTRDRLGPRAADGDAPAGDRPRRRPTDSGRTARRLAGLAGTRRR